MSLPSNREADWTILLFTLYIHKVVSSTVSIERKDLSTLILNVICNVVTFLDRNGFHIDVPLSQCHTAVTLVLPKVVKATLNSKIEMALFHIFFMIYVFNIQN